MKDFNQKVLSARRTLKNLPFFVVAAFLLLMNSSNVRAQLFTQDFSSSTNVADYVSTTPNNSQFNAIGTANSNTTVSINNGTLQFNRTVATSGSAGTFSRTTDFNPVPTSLIYKIDITVSGNTAQTTAAVFQVGSGFGTGNSAEVNASVYARFGVNLTANPGCFTIRDITSGTNSAEFCGTQTITFVLNNSGGTLSYTAPDSTTQTVANDTQDLYIGATLAFNDVAVLTPTQTITDFKFAFTAGIGTIQLDNILINPIAAPTAAGVSLGGRVASDSGRGIWRATVVLTGGSLTAPVYAVTDYEGNYSFYDIPAGETYALSVFVKGYKFNQTSIVVNLEEDFNQAHFIGTPKQKIGTIK